MAQLLRATATTRSPPRPPSSPPPRQTPGLSAIARQVAKATISTALSLNLLLLSPLPTPAQPQPLPPPLLPATQEEYCREDDGAGGGGVLGEEASQPGEFTNESIVEEAWSIVNESYLGAGRRPWSSDTWQRKKEDILSGKIQTRAKAHEIIRRMLAGLGDPYTRFLPPNEFSKMARYDMSGIGINLREVLDNEGKLKMKVMGLLLDGPAHSAGVRQGDEILTVNGNDMRGKSAFEVSSLLQGPTGTLVTIEVRHGNCGPIQSLEVQRMLVARTPVFYRMEELGNGSTSVGYIRLKEFNALARKDFVTAMKRLRDMGASSFILDLRDNLGGLVQAGIEIAKLFLNQGETDVVFMDISPQYIAIWGGEQSNSPLVTSFCPLAEEMTTKVIYTVGRDSQYQNTITTDAAPLITDPVIVLVNSKTASASEIVASALHDNCKAVLVGEKTFGKGLIQSVFELDDGSGLAVTVGKYVTPNHKDINGNGIEPDFRNLPAWTEVGKHISECKRQRQG